MTKILLSALLLAGTQLFSVEMETLQAYYDQGAYQNVIAEASADYAQYDNPKLHLLWAKSAEALGDDITAMSAYERVLLLDPAQSDAQIALVAIYKRLHRDMLSNALYANEFREASTASPRNRELRLDARLSLGYDSNIGANSDLEFTDTLKDERKDTLFSRVNAQISYTRELDTRWFWQAALGAELQLNSDASLYNLYDGVAGMGVGYQNDYATLFIPLSYTRMYYLERDFLVQYGTSPYLNIAITPHMTLNLAFRYLQRRFSDPQDRPRNDDILGSSAGLFYSLDRSYLSIKASYDQYSARETDPLSFTDRQIAYADLGVGKAIDDFLFSADYHFAHVHFDDAFQPGSGDEKRLDTYHRIDLKAGVLLYEQWHLNIEYDYAKNDSNYKYARYDKQVIMTSLQYSY